jgi:hypothetical protein
MARAGTHGVFHASLIAIATGSTGQTYPNGGGLDRHACHHDRKRGGYHCHRGSAPPPPPTFDIAPGRDSAPSNFAPTRTPVGGCAFANCAKARGAGAAPLHRGDPGYGSHRDGDGVECELRRR